MIVFHSTPEIQAQIANWQIENPGETGNSGKIVLPYPTKEDTSGPEAK